MADKKIKFEEAMKELEEIITLFENGEIDLDMSIKKFKRGNELIKICESRLDEAENKLYKIINKDEVEEISENE